ncbi:MAG TPA: hypothetical protein VGK00_01565 [Anaerolineales bacterium]|jgi:hypothetical protein
MSLLVEIIAYAPTAYYQCSHCEIAWREMGKSNQVQVEQLESSLPKDLALEYRAVSDWVEEIFRVYCDQVMVKVIDAASLEGVFKSIRYGARHYPAIIVDQNNQFSGKNALLAAGEEIAHLLDKALINAGRA